MSTNLPIVALVGLVAGVGGAGLSSVLLPGPAEAPAPALSATAPAVDLSGIEERLDRFASRLDEVEMQVAAAPTRRDAAAPAAPQVDLAELKADPELRDIPVVMLTARSNEADIVAGLKSGAAEYLTKPFIPQELLVRISGLLDRSK